MNKLQFLVDVNLPKYFSFFNSEIFFFVYDINARMKDTEIWNLAIKKKFVILTRDTDFYSRALLSKKLPFPKVVYFNLGNITLSELHKYFNTNWKTINLALENNFLIVANKFSIDILI